MNDVRNKLHDSGMNPSFNDLLTMYSNERVGWHPTKKELELLKSCYDINTVLGELFSRLDLGQFGRTFRYYVWKLGDIFEKIIDSRPPFFKLRGLHVPNQTIKDTKVRKVNPDFEHILSQLKHQIPHIHDIKLSTRTEGLYSGLIGTNHVPHRQNHQITIRDFPIISKFNTTATVSRNGNLTVHIGCTYNPISYSIGGFDLLIQHLSQVAFILQARSGGKSFFFPIHQWFVTYYHFNKDGIIIDSPIHHYSIVNLQEHSQIYLKKFPNGKTALRWEKKISPRTTLVEEQEKAGSSQTEYLKLDSLQELYDE